MGNRQENLQFKIITPIPKNSDGDDVKGGLTTDFMHLFLRKTLLLPVTLLALAFSVPVQAQPYGAKDKWMGIYEGEWQNAQGQGKFTAQIRPVGSNVYDGFVMLKNKAETTAVIKLSSLANAAEPEVIQLTGKTSSKELGKEMQFEGKLSGNDPKSLKLAGTLKGGAGDGNLNGERIEKQSPTMGAKPPKDAIVLFDGKQTNHWETFPFLLNNDGSMQVQKENMTAKDRLDNYQLHVEFRTPFMPADQGQARGNSGVYLQSIYEVQVLDSFGLYPLQINDCGSIYGVKTAQGNACLPPMEWQTYDITYLSGDGTAANPPKITIVHNGETVIDAAPVPADKIGKGGGGGNSKGGLLMLQQHGNPVQYRNIWAVPVK